MRSAVIIGGGISGLTAAYSLGKSGVSATIIEPRPYLGGVIRTERVHGCLVEAGPDSFLAAKPWAMDLIRELGLEADVIGSNDHLRKTFIRRHGRLVAMPDGLRMMAPTRLWPIAASPLLGLRTKIRMGLEWFRRPPSRPLPDRSVAEFVRDHYGDEAVEYLAEPLLAGVYGGSPEQLSVNSVLPRFVEMEARYGSLTRGALASRESGDESSQPLFRTLKGGMGQLTDALALGSQVVHSSAESIERTAGGYRVRVAGDWIEATHVVLACEAHYAAPLVAPLDARLADFAAASVYTSSMTVALGFERRALVRPLEGFGFLVPRRERRRVVACTFVGTKFDHRVPDDLALLRCFLGGDGALAESDDVVIETVLDELRDLAGIAARPLFTRIFRWPRSMAQYTVGHQRRLSEIESRLAELPGVHLAGNAYYGIGIPDCVRLAKEVAGRIAAAP